MHEFWRKPLTLFVVASVVGVATGQNADVDKSIAEYRMRMVAAPAETSDEAKGRSRPAARLVRDEQVIKPVDPQSQLPERQALISQPYSTSTNTMPTPLQVLAEIPDPRHFQAVFQLRLERVEKSREQRIAKNYKRVIDKATGYMARMAHKRQVDLSLVECIQRTLANNYSIRASAYGPAISVTDLVQAEAVFDTVFFLDANYGHNDTPAPTWDGDNPQTDVRGYDGGFRKLLPTGMRVETSLGQSSAKQGLEPKQNTLINPSWDTKFTASLTQPLLKGFGLDYNRSAIEVQKVNLKISREQFQQEVRDRLFQAEQAYWNLARARRSVLITVESVAQNEVTLENVVARGGYDATPIQANNTRSRLKQSVVTFQSTVKVVRDAEDSLKSVMNDPEFLHSDDIEIIPTESPFAAALAIDQFAEVRTALDGRSEIRQAKLAIEAARINTARTKNEVMPRLDVSFQYTVEGLRGNPSTSFDNLTTNRFNSYNVVVAFEVPIGQRGPKANLRKSELQESQTIVRLHQVTDQVVVDVNNAVRALAVDWDNVPPALDAVVAADANLRALQERTDRTDPSYLETELNGVEQLANTRAGLLRVIVDYNIALVALETAKGTLLQYNNVVAADEPVRR